MQATRSNLFLSTRIALQAQPQPQAVRFGSKKVSAPAAMAKLKQTPYFLATLPWNITDERDKFAATQGAKFDDGGDIGERVHVSLFNPGLSDQLEYDMIIIHTVLYYGIVIHCYLHRRVSSHSLVASSITTSRRTSPVAGALALQLDSIKKSGGAWLLIKAKTEEEAVTVLRNQFAGQQAWDVGRASIQSVNGMGEEFGQAGPLFHANKTTPSVPTDAKVTVVQLEMRTDGPLYSK